nr:hypothetical protein 8 [Paracoccaceae bacterium]
MLEILLVFSINGKLPDISDRIFTSFEECAEFVNMVADDDIVNSDYGFKFLASDGAVFEGQCIELEDWFLKKSV